MFLPTYLPYFFSDRYRKQTISFFRPNIQHLGHYCLALLIFPEIMDNPQPCKVVIIKKGPKLRRICGILDNGAHDTL